MKNVSTAIEFLWLALAVFSVGGLAKPETNSRLSEDIQPLIILNSHCAGCHQQTNHPGALFLKAEKLSEPQTIRLLIKVIENSKMPPAHADFKKTEAGKQLLAWLKEQQSQNSKAP